MPATTKTELLGLIKLGNSNFLAGFVDLPIGLNKMKSGDLEELFRKAALIQMLSRYGGISTQTLSQKSEAELRQRYKKKLLKQELTNSILELDNSLPPNRQLLFVSSPQNFIIRKRDKVPLRELSIPEMEDQLRKFEKKLPGSVTIKLPTTHSIYREQVEKKITSAKLKEICQEKGLVPPKTKKELLKMCLADQDVKNFIISLRDESKESKESKDEGVENVIPISQLTTEDLERIAIEDKLRSLIVKFAFSDNPKHKAIQNTFTAVPIGKYIYKKDLSLLEDLTTAELRDLLSQLSSSSDPSKLVDSTFTDLSDLTTSSLIKSIF